MRVFCFTDFPLKREKEDSGGSVALIWCFYLVPGRSHDQNSSVHRPRLGWMYSRRSVFCFVFFFMYLHVSTFLRGADYRRCDRPLPSKSSL